MTVQSWAPARVSIRRHSLASSHRWRVGLVCWRILHADIAAAKAERYTPPIKRVSHWLLIMSDVTRILSAIEQGDSQAAEQLLPLVYDELRKLAAHKLAQEKPGQTLQATALVHEAYLRLVQSGNASERAVSAKAWNSRGHFFAAAAEAMRRILVDNARRKLRPKHGGDRRRVDLDQALSVADPEENLVALDDALARLAAQEPVKAEVVKLRYFAGLSVEETARCLGISPATVKRHWTVARAWLFAALSENEAGPTPLSPRGRGSG